MKLRVALAVGATLLSSCGEAMTPQLNASEYFSEPGAVALGEAACLGQVDKVQALILEAAPVNAVGREGMTPLALAVMCQSEAGVRALLEAGADPNYRHESRYTTVWLAADVDNPAIMRLLLEHGGDPHATSPDGTTVLMRALALGIRNMGRDAWGNYYLLLERDVDINQADKLRRTIVGDAVALGRFDKVAELLERGYTYDLLSVAWSTENIAVTEERIPDVERVKVMLRERGVHWPIPHPLSGTNRIEYMQAHPDYAAKHPESWPDSYREKNPIGGN